MCLMIWTQFVRCNLRDSANLSVLDELLQGTEYWINEAFGWIWSLIGLKYDPLEELRD
jgi:hypothetical protein